MSRLRIRLARAIELAVLEQCDREVIVDPINGFSIATGFWRTNRHSDSYRWSCTAALKEAPGVKLLIDSYDTMTECARNGITLCKDRSRAITYEATAREPT